MHKYAIYDTVIGFIKIEYLGDTLLSLNRIRDITPTDFGEKNSFTDNIYSQLCEYFSGKRKSFTIKYELSGTDFQKKVWNALCDIPYGQTRSYKDIAIAIGNGNACRAVGLANNKNPISILIPCHRVIGSSGKLVGYGGGLDMKEFLLTLEKLNIN